MSQKQGCTQGEEGGGGGPAAPVQTCQNWNVKNTDIGRDDIKSFMRLTLQPKSADYYYISILKNKLIK
jgi:hypothetical protein